MLTCDSGESADLAVKGDRKRPLDCSSVTDGEPVGKSRKQSLADYEQCPSSFLCKFLMPLVTRDTVDEFHDQLRWEYLLDWLFRKDLLKTPAYCIYCSKKNLHLHYVRELWECEDCKKTFSIREDSFFADLSCSIKHILQCIIGWADKNSESYTASVLDVKFVIVQRVYQQCVETIYNYLQDEHAKNWSLGGTGSVALLDLWPNGFIPPKGWTKDKLVRRKYQDRLRVLWIADTNHVPVRYMAHLLPAQKHLKEIQSEFKMIQMDFGVSWSSESESNESVLICNGTQRNDESEHAISTENTNNGTDSGEKLQRHELRIMRELQDTVTLKEDMENKCQKSASKKKKASKKKNQFTENKPKEGQLCNDGDEGCKLIQCETNQNLDIVKVNVSMSSERIVEDRNSIIQDNAEGPKEDDIVVSDKGDLDEENVANSSNPRKSRRNPRKSRRNRGNQNPVEKALKEVERLRKQEFEEYLRDVELAHCVLPVVQNYIAPGSLVVVNDETLPYVASSLHRLGKYESVRTVSDLISTADQSTISILENIWKDAAPLCSDLMTKTYISAKRTIAEFQWRLTFGPSPSEAVYHILLQIADYYKPVKEKSMSTL